MYKIDLLALFPYYQNFKGDFFPVVPLQLNYRGKTVDSSALIDSGATISIFKSDVADEEKKKILRLE